MPEILEIREIPVKVLVMGEGQTRVRRVEADIDQLTESIRVHGLLEPILVCPHNSVSGVFEVLAGQRRVIAHQKLGRENIMAAVINEPIDEERAKAISLTENIIRRDLDAKDVIDACTVLYRRYGSARAVADETGIPYSQVLKHLKYDRLNDELRKKVDSGEIDLNIALKAQDAAVGQDGLVSSAEAVDLAEALVTMNGVERRQILREKAASPDRRVREILENFWEENEKVKQILVTVPAGVHKALRLKAKETHSTQDEIAAGLICDAVSGWPDNARG